MNRHRMVPALLVALALLPAPVAHAISLPPQFVAEDMAPGADKMPAAKDVASTLKKLADDKKVALDMVAKVGEKDLGSKLVAAPWDDRKQPIGVQFLHMVGHLNNHKGQLFYYLKLQGKPVDTMTLYGMG